ncbi:MAG: aminotransferase class V-fold PLP-dependent enzyme [Phycisphaerae bacterium]|nr:aminotransferase class V-fold PLP-dependent enzyme [Phycisphaerae bacterium]MDW8262140.1 aminotransferase class V-fold PLP-dependent enzyme [Phycisphaerales bacterium]
MDVIYLDNNATTRPDPAVIEAMLPFFGEQYGNPSSVHRLGQRARAAIDQARQQVARLLGCNDSELLFTSGGTESINTAVRGLATSRLPRRRIITSSVEHSATRELCQQMLREGWEMIEIGVDRAGLLDLDRLERELDDHTALATFLWANNETGVVFPMAKIVHLCRSAGVPLHVDATQAVGKIPVHLRELGCDAASFAAHKFHGPKGVGGLFVRRGLRMPPLLIGGPQERGRRGGTENVAGIVGMGTAAELAVKSLGEMSRVADLRDRLEHGVLRSIPETSVNGTTASRLPNTSNISFAALEAEAILLLLSEQGICASAGAACSSGSLEPSHVLRAMGIEDRIAHGAIRFSLSRFTTVDEIDRTLAVLPSLIERLRVVLPVG